MSMVIIPALAVAGDGVHPFDIDSIILLPPLMQTAVSHSTFPLTVLGPSCSMCNYYVLCIFDNRRMKKCQICWQLTIRSFPVFFPLCSEQSVASEKICSKTMLPSQNSQRIQLQSGLLAGSDRLSALKQ